MKQRITDFLSSFGIMLAGLVLLFVGSVSFEPARGNLQAKFPEAGWRNVEGGDIVSEVLPTSSPAAPLCKNGSNCDLPLSAAAALAMDANSGIKIFEKNSQEIRPLASITKLMSALVMMDLPMRWSSTTQIIDSDYNGSDHHTAPGEKYLLEDLWHVALIGSSNSAINALVRMSGITVEQFVNRMNNKARELGLLSLRFSEPTGLSEKNMGNAEDVGQLLKEALGKGKIYKAMRIGEYYARPLNKRKPRRVWNTNWLLTKWIPNNFKITNIAGKTGYIIDAGYNFAVSLETERQRPLIVVVLGATSTQARFTEARDLAGWIFDHYLWPGEEGYEGLSE